MQPDIRKKYQQHVDCNEHTLAGFIALGEMPPSPLRSELLTVLAETMVVHLRQGMLLHDQARRRDEALMKIYEFVGC